MSFYEYTQSREKLRGRTDQDRDDKQRVRGRESPEGGHAHVAISIYFRLKAHKKIICANL